MKCALFALIFAACGSPWYDAWKSQREATDAMRPPSTLEPTSVDRETPPAAIRIRVRIFAANDYRAGMIDWRKHIAEQIEQVNRALVSAQMELVVVDTKEWEHRSGASLMADLHDLQSFDAGADVDLVVGYVSALPVFTMSQHQLGLAWMLGKHFVVRGMDDRTEYDALTSSNAMLSADHLREIYYDRKRHKELAAFIHELGHTLALPHTPAQDDYMYPTYTPHENGFSRDNADLLRVSLAHPDRHTQTGWRAWYADLDAMLARHATRREPDADEQELVGLVSRGLRTPAAASLPAASPASQPASRAVGEVQEISESESDKCKVVGMRRVDIPVRGEPSARDAQGMLAVKAATAKSGGDSVIVQRQERNGKAFFFATMYRCH